MGSVFFDAENTQTGSWEAELQTLRSFLSKNFRVYTNLPKG